MAKWICGFMIVLCVPCFAADTLDEAKRVAKQANVHYQLGRFSDAADAYSKSYELAPAPGLLFNLGQCQMALKSYDRAIFFFEGYLRDKPDAPNVALVRDLIAEAHREIDAQKAKAEAAEAAKIAALTRVAPPPPPPPPPPPRDRRRIAAIALGAASIPLVGAGVYLGLRAGSADDLSQLAPAASDAQAAFVSTHHDDLIAAAVIGGLGAACAVSSGVLGYFGWRHAPGVAIAPVANGGAAMFSGSF